MTGTCSGLSGGLPCSRSGDGSAAEDTGSRASSVVRRLPALQEKIEGVKRSGTADLPLHGGRVPAWLAERMTQLGTAIAEQVVLNYGPSELLTRLSDPFWFQALGCVMGMDWHSSGITTSVMGALQRGLNPRLRISVLPCAGGADGIRGARPMSCAVSRRRRVWMARR